MLRINLTANYIQLKICEKKGVFEYEVKFEPAVDAQYIRFELLNQLKEMIGIAKTFDGTALYLPFHTCEKVGLKKLKL
jgi:aubergine